MGSGRCTVKSIPRPPSGQGAKKRASQEAWPKGLGHWDWITSTGATSSISNGCDGGWTVGGGFEYGFTPYLSAGVEYSFTRINIGDRSQSVSPGFIAPETVTGAHSGIQTLMARLNFRFAQFW